MGFQQKVLASVGTMARVMSPLGFAHGPTRITKAYFARAPTYCVLQVPVLTEILIYHSENRATPTKQKECSLP